MELTQKSGHWDPKHVDMVNQHEAKAQDKYYSSKYTTHIANNEIVRVPVSTHIYLSNLKLYRSDFNIKLKLLISGCALCVIQMGVIPSYT